MWKVLKDFLLFKRVDDRQDLVLILLSWVFIAGMLALLVWMIVNVFKVL